jgi:competence protein ComEA
MIWFTEKERLALAVWSALALVALGILLWQRQRPPLTIEGAPAPIQAALWDESLRTSRQVDVNTAGVAELERLPEIGPALAQRIVDDRRAHGRFRTPEELSRVPGIGPKTYDAVKDYVTTK